MIHAEAVIEQVRTGTAPQSWQVFHANKSQEIWYGFLATVLCLFVLVDLIFLLILIPTYSAINVLGITYAVFTGILLVAFTIFIVGGWIYHLRHIQEPVFILMPEGVVEHHWEPVVRAQTISFASPLRTSLASKSRIHKLPALMVRDAHGLLKEWRPSTTFGNPDQLMRAIITAYDNYIVSYQANNIMANQEVS